MLVFVAITVMAFATHQKTFVVVTAVGMSVFAALAFVESFIAHVVVEADAIAIKGMLTTQRIALSDVEKVSAEGGRTSLLMKTGKWKKLPEWIGSNMSVRRRVADRLKG
jgi:hypothetical protein